MEEYILNFKWYLFSQLQLVNWEKKYIWIKCALHYASITLTQNSNSNSVSNSKL